MDVSVAGPKVHRDISRIADRAHTNRIDQRLENLLVFRGWVFDYMGDVSSQNYQTDRPHRFDRLQHFVLGEGGLVQAIACSWIWKVLRADVVTFYRFDHSSHELHAEAYYASGPSFETWAQKHAELVKNIGRADRTENSFLYNVCETGEALISNDGREIRGRENEQTEIVDLQRADLKTPASFYILPIKHGKRIIGLIECIGFRPFAFDDFSSALIDEFCELLGKYFIAQANAQLVNDVRSALAPENWLAQTKNRFDLLCSAVAKYFFVHSVSAWVVDPFDQNRLKLDGSVNRPNPQHFRLKGEARLSVLVDKKDSLTAKAIREKKWIYGRVGEGEFGGEWVHVDAHRAFLAAGMKYIAIVPVLGPNGEALASLTLLSKYSEFSNDWRPQIDFCARVLATGLVDMALIERVLNDGLSDTSHEIRNIAKHLARAASKLTESFKVNEILEDTDDDQNFYNPLELYLSDIKAFSDDLTAINEIMSPSGFLEFYKEPGFKGSPLVRRLVEDISISQIDLRDIWNQEYETLRSEISTRSLNFDPRWKTSRATVPIDRKATSIVIRNVLGNAVKYAKFGSTVSVTIGENTSRRNFQLKVENLGPHLEVEEEDRIFLRKFQGFRAKQMDASGRGEGLYQAYAFMRAQRGNLTHRQTPTTDKDFSVQTFRVTFNY
jgi:signal transduction histidine kinase